MLVEKAYLSLYPEAKLGRFRFALKYSGRFNDYNGNITRRGDMITVNLSKTWKGIDPSIQTGIIQHLLNRLLKTKIPTREQELYDIFLRKAHLAAPKTKSDPLLDASFSRVNERYFNGMMDKPNLVWGSASVRKLGHYEYGTDLVMVSTVLKDDEELLDYVMHHELLHKKHKWTTSNGKTYHHTPAFRKDERRFEDWQSCEKRLSRLARRRRFSLGF